LDQPFKTSDTGNPKIPIRQKDPQDRLIHHGDLLEKLGILNPKFPIILVGGTNGKGSTTHMIGRIFMEAGYKVGINTSPHLIKFNERARINELPVSDAELNLYLSKINADFSDFPLGYNEYSFLLGLYAFIDQKVDLAVFEIGLGGRFDPANLMSAKVSVITNIDLDHTEILGNTLEKIAREKAEIIKFSRPIISGDINCPLAKKVIKTKAEESNARLYSEGEDFSFAQFQKKYDLPYPYILECNAAMGIQAALLASEFLPIKNPDLKTVLSQAVKNTKVPGRLQEISWKNKLFPKLSPKLLIDVCHNPGGCKNLKNYLDHHPITGKNYGVFAVSATKDAQQMIQILSANIDHWILPEVQNLQQRDELLESFPQDLKLDPSKIYKNIKNIKDSLRFLDSQVTSADRVIIFGSFYLAGEFLCELDQQKR
jgi:dihydrofolate synthase/folylpolyglutamate synthase